MGEPSLLGPKFIARLLRILPWVEARMGLEDPQAVTTPRFPHRQDIKFQLLETLVKGSEDTVRAAIREWDPSAKGGKGGFVANCDKVILVADSNDVGHNAGRGGCGSVQMYKRLLDGTLVGAIYDLCCPGDELPLPGECP